MEWLVTFKGNGQSNNDVDFGVGIPFKRIDSKIVNTISFADVIKIAKKQEQCHFGITWDQSQKGKILLVKCYCASGKLTESLSFSLK